MSFDDLVIMHAKGLATAPGSENAEFQSFASENAVAFPREVRCIVREVNEADDPTYGAGDIKRGKFPIMVVLFKHEIPEIRVLRDTLKVRGAVYTIKDIYYEDAGSWEVYCGR